MAFRIKKGKRGNDEFRLRNAEVEQFLCELITGKGRTSDYSERIGMGMTPKKLRRYWQKETRTYFPASALKALFRASDFDLSVANFFLLDGSPFRLERIQVSDEVDAVRSDVGRALVSLGTLKGRINELYLRFTDAESEQGEAISKGEAEELALAMDELIEHAKQLRLVLGEVGEESIGPSAEQGSQPRRG